MIYATYSDFAARYATKLTEAEVSSHLLPVASARLEGALGPYFGVPLGADNLTAADLTIDLAYLLVLQRSKAPGDAAALESATQARLDALASGKAAMITSSGALLYAQATPSTVWASNTESCATFHPTRATEE